jgi:2-(1,2-epoxy-1,2-dihydrophenyl)acetyl-CoA isomerase
MSEVEGLAYECDGGVVTVRLDRPEKLKAITWTMVQGVTRYVEEAGRDPEVRVVVITGTGRAFSSGDDIVSGMGDPPGGWDRQGLHLQRGPHYEMVRTILSTPKPVVAALNGLTHGAGWVIALSCDFRVARSDIVIGDIRAQKAIFANQGVGLLLPALIGKSRAMDLLMTGRVIDAAEAERYGIINRLWPAESYEQDLAAFVEELAQGPTRNYAAWKLSANQAVLKEFDEYTDFERWLGSQRPGVDIAVRRPPLCAHHEPVDQDQERAVSCGQVVHPASARVEPSGLDRSPPLPAAAACSSRRDGAREACLKVEDAYLPRLDGDLRHPVDHRAHRLHPAIALLWSEVAAAGLGRHRLAPRLAQLADHRRACHQQPTGRTRGTHAITHAIA